MTTMTRAYLGARLGCSPADCRWHPRTKGALVERMVMSLAEWQAVAHELAGLHNVVAPPGLLERINELLEQAPRGWPEQSFALELDAGSVEVVRSAHAALIKRDPDAGQRIASVAEAVRIIHDHQQRS